MSALYNHDEEVRRRLAEVVSKQRSYRDYSHHTPSVEQRKTDGEIKISVLTEENEKLKKEKTEWLKKIKIVIEAYEKLEIENKELKAKFAKREKVTKTVGDTKNFFKGIWSGFIKWLNT